MRVASDPFEILTVEHYPIIEVASVLAAMRSDSEIGAETLKKAIEFIKRFADRYHHEKEETILFNLVRDRNLDVSPIEAMEKEHEMVREKVRRAVESLDRGDVSGAVIHLRDWANFIPDHIDRENHSLFPGLARFFDEGERAEMVERFRKVDQELGTIQDMQKIADELFQTIIGKTGEAIVEARAVRKEDRDALVKRLTEILPRSSSMLVMYDEKPGRLLKELELMGGFEVREVRKGDVYAFRITRI